jgi:hypothetical protein
MKKVYLSVIGFSIICRCGVFAQTKHDTTFTRKQVSSVSAPVGDSSSYKSRQLRLDEVNLVSSYYFQYGDHSAITGGIGTQNVTDVANGLDLKFLWYGNNNNKNTLTTAFGIDYHTSASSAFVTKTGLGKQDGTRIYPSVDWTVENAKTGNTFGLGAYYSGEYNYKSLGADMHFSLKTADKNGELGVKVQAYLDQVTLIYPAEFVAAINPAPTGSTYVTTASGNLVLSSSGGAGGRTTKPNLASSPRNTYSASLSWSQVINSRLQITLLGDVVTQNGYLGLPFHRVYFSNAKDTIEKLPSTRFKLPVGIRANYFWGDYVILRSYYRYYTDNWGINSNTANLEVVLKATPFFSISPFYRYYNQSAAKYFQPYEVHKVTDQYYTSNYEYAKFESSFFGVGLRVAPPAGVFGWRNLHDLEIRYGHYAQTTDLVSDVISFNLGFK